MIGSKTRGWRRQALSKILEGIVLKEAPIEIDNWPVLASSQIVKPKESTVESEVQYFMSLVAKFMLAKRKYHKLGRFLREEKVSSKNSLAKQLYLLMSKSGALNFAGIALVFLISVTLFVIADVWLGTWKTRLDLFDNHYSNFGIYAILACSAALFVIFRDAFYRIKFLQISNFYNKRLIESIVKTSIGFFMETPANRLVYRLSYD